jgi:hypothetical protein
VAAGGTVRFAVDCPNLIPTATTVVGVGQVLDIEGDGHVVGRTNREIGAELFMSPKTASVHVSRILRKLNVRGRVEAAAFAHRRGLE